MTDKNNRKECGECGRGCSADEIRIVDGKGICLNCLCGDAKPITINPIGIVVNDKKRAKGKFGTTGGDISEIRLHPGQKRFMSALAEETHLTIIWYLHQACDIRTVFNRGWDGKEVGPFASRTPDRLTPIAVTDVELIEVRGTTLIVRGLDAINGTPVLDIKVSRKSLKRGV